MAELKHWLRSEARRQAARPDLLAALLGGGSFAYARHRLSFNVLRTLIRTGVHAIEIQLLIAAFVPWEYVVPLLTYRALAALLGAEHWGALEVMRTKVRDAVRRRRPEAVRLAIEQGFGLTLWAAGGLALIVAGLETASTFADGAVELRSAYALACVLRLGLDSALRSLHSGLYAVRRVPRPLWSTVGPDLVELAVILFGFGDLGLWSIPLATLAGGACDASLAYVFVRRGYLQRRFQLPRIMRSLALARQITARAAGPGLHHALASLTLQLDGVLLLLLAHAEQGGGATASFAALYYVLRPLLAASTHWVRAFYFDLKLVESGPLRVFRPQLVRFLERLAVAWAGGLALVTLGLSTVLLGEHLGLASLVLLPFFVARSAFALVQVIAFGAGDLTRLLKMGGVVLAGLLALRALGVHDVWLIAALTLLLGVIAARARAWARQAVRSEAQPGLLDYAAWLAWVRSRESLRIAVLQVEARSSRVGAIVRGLRRNYGTLAITRWGRRYVLLAAEEAEMPGTRSLVLACGGALHEVWVSKTAPPLELFAAAHRARALPPGWATHALRARNAPDYPALERSFAERFRAGQVCDLTSGRGLKARAVTPAALRALVGAIEARSRGREARSERTLPFLIAVYAPCGQARALFIADRDTAGFEKFRSEVHDASIRASWATLFDSMEIADASRRVAH